MARQRYEKRSFGTALTTYLQAIGWVVTYTEGYKSDSPIQPPQIAVTFPPSTRRELQLGRLPGKDSLFRRIVQVDAYMENEERADAIIDDIMDFIDITPISVVDQNTNFLATLICQDTESIFGEVLPPITTDPKIGRWRGVVRAQMEAHYPES